MRTTRRQMLTAMAAAPAMAQSRGGVTRFVRFRKTNRTAFGILDGETIFEIAGDLFGARKENGVKHRLRDVKLLYPVEPSKILALAGNYRSHLGTQPPAAHPEPFYKPVSSLQNPGDPIVIPQGATNVHHECELVVVIGKRASNVTVEEARDCILGVTCGNDVSEREWQNGKKKDVQWWRAKGADTFSPVGPVIARGIDYGNLGIQARVNGKVMQKDSTDHLVHDCPTTVSFISQFVTLMPGDLIFTGTPGTTSPMKPGDVVEVEIDGIGVLKNPLQGS